MYIILFMSLVYGLIIGSFLNVVIYRIPLGKKLGGRSKCPTCNHTLTPLELVPVFSYLGLGRKCKNCKEKISPRYMTVELLTGILFTIYAYVLIQYGAHFMYSTEFMINLVTGFLIISSLVSLAFIDLDTMEIPDRFHVILLICGITLTIVNGGSLLSSLLAGVVIGIPLLLVALFTPGLGLGDVKLLFTSGVMFGAYNSNIGILIGCVSAIIYSIVFKIGKGREFSFGPHLAIGMYGALLITMGQLI